MPNATPPVIPAIPLSTEMERIASFRPGVWNGVPYTADFVRQLHQNFQRYSTGSKPWYTPYLNLNHKDEFRFGRIGKATLEDGTLYLWADRIPMNVATILKSHMLDAPSIEFIEPKNVNGVIRGFVGPDGKIVQGPVLKCLSLLGNEVPAVKGLPPLPTPTVSAFRDTGGYIVRFSLSSKGKRMNPDLLNRLQQLQFNTATLPADATDDLGNEILRILQGQNANPAAGTVTPNADNVTQVPPVVPPATPPATGAATPFAIPGMGGQTPEQIVMKFAGQHLATMISAAVAPVQNQLKTVTGQLATMSKHHTDQLTKGRDEIIRRFCDEMGTSGQVSPAMRPSIETMLRGCDHTNVRKFADGKTDGTGLDEAMHGIRTSYPKQPNAPTNQGQPRVPQPGVVAPGTGGVRADVVQRVLASTPEGKAALAKRAKAAA